jgi:hypothetical protein
MENVTERCAHEESFVDDVALDEVLDAALALLEDADQAPTSSSTASQSERNLASP